MLVCALRHSYARFTTIVVQLIVCECIALFFSFSLNFISISRRFLFDIEGYATFSISNSCANYKSVQFLSQLLSQAKTSDHSRLFCMDRNR